MSKNNEFVRFPMLPEFRVADFERSKRFYLGLGFKIFNERPEDKFMLIRMEEISLMIMQLTTDKDSWNGYAPMEYPLGRGMHIQMEVSDVDKLYARVKELKIPFFRDIMTNSYREQGKMLKCKEFLIQDPDGYLLRFSTTSF